MPQRIAKGLEHDAVGSHLIGILHTQTNKEWVTGEPSPASIFGRLKTGDAKYIFPRLGGPDFRLMYSENTPQVVEKISEGDVVGGFCFLSTGLVIASKRVVDKKGNEFEVQVDLKNPLPKPLFEGGKPMQKLSIKRLRGAEVTREGWRLKSPGSAAGVPLHVLVKAIRYFEVARTCGGKLTLMIPTHEYGVGVAANAQLLGIPREKAVRAVREIGRNYARTLRKLGKEFFPDIELSLVLTHDEVFQKKLKKFEERHNKEIAATQTGKADGFIVDATPAQTKAMRELWQEENESYMRLFSFIFSRRKPTVFMLHARDFAGYPLEGLQAAEKIVGNEFIKRNVAFLGVTGGPVVSTKIEWPPLLALTPFGQESKILGGRDNALPSDVDVRLDGYFGTPKQLASTNYLPDRLGGPLLAKGGGKCAFLYYVRNLGPYVGVVPEGSSIKQIRSCVHHKSHEGCKELFLKTYGRFIERLK